MQHHSRKQEIEMRHHDSTDITTRSIGVHPFVMADTLLQLAKLRQVPSIAYTSLNASITTIAERGHSFVKFVCNVAQHVSRFSEADEIESLLLTTSGFRSPPTECSNENRDLLSGLGFEIAFAFSEETGVDIDHRFADTIAANNKAGNLRSDVVQTPRRRIQVSGFKWEEGLCEWVAATPLPLNRAGRADSSDFKDPYNDKEQPRSKHDDLHQTPKKSTAIVLPSSPDIITAGEQQTEAPKHPVITLPKVSVQASRPALRERSANQPLPQKQKRFTSSTSKESTAGSDTETDHKPPQRLLKPIVPKQVHLKEERAKRAALLLATTTSHPTAAAATAPGLRPALTQPQPSKQLKRSLSFVEKTDQSDRRNGDPGRDQAGLEAEDSDELGLLTPVRKKRVCTRGSARSSSHARGKRLSSTASKVPVREMHDQMSDDELGL
jgi:hypothetical protein